MRLGAISGRTFGHNAGGVPHEAVPQANEPRSESRALVAVEPQAERTDRPMAYRDAPFLAQLLATKADLPQTRARRRAEPADVLAAYRSVAALVR
jgi:hypothetical protein